MCDVHTRPKIARQADRTGGKQTWKQTKGDDPTQSLGAQTRKPGAQKVIAESQGLNKLVKKADVDDNFAF